jgi:hypothetical protein
VGDIEQREFLQVNIVQVGNNLCGYSWDYLYNNKNDYCKAYFTGSHNKTEDTWFLNGYSFMENHFTHALMQFKLRLDETEGNVYLIGLVRTKAELFFRAGDPIEIKLKKISNRPEMMTQAMKDCIASFEPPKKEKPIIQKPVIVVPKEKPVVQKPIIPKKKDSIIQPVKDTVKKTVPIVKIIPKENILPTKVEGRANKELKRIVINEKKLFLNIYDNGTVDGDTVSILYNGKTIVSKKRISEKPITVELVLDENSKYHSIVLFAENLGSIPPNTALLIFSTPNGKRYELFASANLQQNAEIIFEYKPD